MCPESRTLDRFRGCLLAGAVGDALGGPIEFWSAEQIRRTYGSRVTLPALDDGRFTDDTQMTLFTAEGLIRAGENAARADLLAAVHAAYLRWLHTQGDARISVATDGWLVGNRLLHRQMAPGNTCLAALRSGQAGTVTDRINTSKGCGGVMRAAPVGLLIADAEEAFRAGCDAAAITHGHPSGYLTAGALAAMVALLVDGAELPAVVEIARELVGTDPEGGETARALEAAVALASDGVPAPEDLERLGGGWVGEEALAIAVACALTAEDLPSALSVAVLHSGDSDSTGAICGNLLGASQGVEAVPAGWLNVLDGGEIVDAVARDLWTMRFAPESVDESWLERYPPS